MPHPRPCSISRRGFTMLEFLIAVALVAVLAAIAVPNFSAGYRRGGVRACYANQKTIAGAIEMYNLDFNTSATTLDSGMFQKLQENGYLQSVPRDPGTKLAAGVNYVMSPGIGQSGSWVYCMNHGGIHSYGNPELTWHNLDAFLWSGTLEAELSKHAAHPDALNLARAVSQSVSKRGQSDRVQGRHQGWVEGTLGSSSLFILGWLFWFFQRRQGATTAPVRPAPLDPTIVTVLAATPGLLQPRSTDPRAQAWRPAEVAPQGKCPVCSTGFEEATDSGAALDCPSCHTAHHRECRDFLRGCGIYGCEG